MKTLLILLVLGQSADLNTTIYGRAHGCVEMNPILAHSSTAGMVGIKVFSITSIAAAGYVTKKKGKTKLSKAIMLAGFVVGAAAAGWNVSQFIGGC